MIDFTPVREQGVVSGPFAAATDYRQLAAATTEIYATIRQIIAAADNAAVAFVPHDPAQTDPAEHGWDLSHVIVHLTAGMEEAAAHAVTLARGVAVEGRSRYETPWEGVRSVAQVTARLAESERMCNGFLRAWPDTPDLALTITPVPQFGPLNATARYLLGVMHADGHLEQLREIMRQAGKGV